MPSNDDTEHYNAEATKGPAVGDAPARSVLLADHAAGADETRSHNLSTDEVSSAPFSLDHSSSEEFTFFQKKKRADQSVLAPSVPYATTAQVTAFAAQLDSAVAVNIKTQRHIAELMALMSDVARTVTADAPKPKRKRLRQSKWLFYACLVGLGVGWFLLFPSGHNIITQLVVFLAR